MEPTNPNSLNSEPQISLKSALYKINHLHCRVYIFCRWQKTRFQKAVFCFLLIDIVRCPFVQMQPVSSMEAKVWDLAAVQQCCYFTALQHIHPVLLAAANLWTFFERKCCSCWLPGREGGKSPRVSCFPSWFRIRSISVHPQPRREIFKSAMECVYMCDTCVYVCVREEKKKDRQQNKFEFVWTYKLLAVVWGFAFHSQLWQCRFQYPDMPVKVLWSQIIQNEK